MAWPNRSLRDSGADSRRPDPVRPRPRACADFSTVGPIKPELAAARADPELARVDGRVMRAAQRREPRRIVVAALRPRNHMVDLDEIPPRATRYDAPRVVPREHEAAHPGRDRPRHAPRRPRVDDIRIARR